MATVHTYDTAEGKRYKVEWDLPKRMLPAGKSRGKGSLTVKTVEERNAVKQMAELAKHAITGAQISDFLKQTLFGDDDLPVVTGTTLVEWQERFLDTKKGKWNGKHGHDQRRKITKIIVPALGKDRAMDSIEGKEIDALCWALHEGKLDRSRTALDYQLPPMAFRTVDSYWDLMRQMFGLAHRHGVIPMDPIAISSWTKGMVSDTEEEINKHSDRYFEPDDFSLFLAQIRPDYRLFVELLVETGLRFSEATALKVKDVDFQHKILTVRRAYKGYFPGGGGEIGPTKNRAYRHVGLTDRMADLLKLKIADLPPQSDAKDLNDRFIFRGTRGGVILNSNFRRDHWNPAMIRLQQCSEHPPTRVDGRSLLLVLDKKKISTCGCLGARPWTAYTPHTLRHTLATWLIDEGENIEWVSQLLGHSSTKVTEEVYVHQIRRSKQYGRTASAIDRKRGRVIREALHRAA